MDYSKKDMNLLGGETEKKSIADAVKGFCNRHPRICGVIIALIVLQILLTIPATHDMLYKFAIDIVIAPMTAFCVLMGVI